MTLSQWNWTTMPRSKSVDDEEPGEPLEVDVSAEAYARLEQEAARRGVSIEVVVEDLVKQYLAEPE